MPGIQEWIHKLEEGEWTRYIKWAVVVLGLLALTALYDIQKFRNFATQEAMDTAQLARNIANGKGYTTDFVRPLSIHLLQQHRGEEKPVLKEPHPDLANPPVYPLLLAGLMKVLPFNYTIPRATFWRYQPEMLIAFFNQALFFAALVLVFRIARRLFDASVAWVAAIVVAGTELFWRFSVSGLPTMLLTVLFLGIVWCLVALEQNSREEKWGGGRFSLVAVLAGALVGIGGITLYSFAWLILPVLGFLLIFLGPRRWVVSAATLAAFLVILTPWLARNYQTSGKPFGTAGYALFQDTAILGGTRLERLMSKKFEEDLSKTGVDQIFRKLLVNANSIVQNELPKLGGNWVTALFLASLLIPFRSLTLSRIRIFLLLCLAVLVVVQALGRTHLSTDSPEINSENLLVWIAPLLFIFGTGMYFILLDQINLPFPQLRTVINGVFAVLVSAPLVFKFLPPRSHPYAYPPYWPPGIQDISQWMEEKELMMSDMPWAIAWYGGRQCVWVTVDSPIDPKQINGSDFFSIYDYQKPIQGLYLTMLTTDARFFSQMLKDKDYAWGRFMLKCLLETNVPTGFPLRHTPQGLIQNGQLFLTDRIRWKTSQP
jgi:hypothetical protein